ncbi:MAG: DUF5915 domain-containing protein, partial [Candidatus Edwardsbacteria bacterium]|nr:DUF5915 domain-containing protein [Candidatus Edwardsbacteria bacterium]
AKPVFSLLGPKHGKNASKVAQTISALSDEQVKAILIKGEDAVRIGDQDVSIRRDDFEVIKKSKEGYSIKQEGNYAVGLNLAINDKLKTEGRARELVHHIQNLRKEMNFEVSDRIQIGLDIPLSEIRSELESKYERYIKDETLGEVIFYQLLPNATNEQIISVDLNGVKISISIQRTT